MMEWFVENNVTIISVAISYMISALFFHVGNRNNLKMSVIHPAKRLLIDERCTPKGYKKLEKLTRDYSSRYLYFWERKKINRLLDLYEKVTKYNRFEENAESLVSYFLNTLEKNGIITKDLPISIDGEIVGMEYPYELQDLCLDIAEMLKKYQYTEDEMKIKESIASCFNGFISTIYNRPEIDFFIDCSYREVLNNSEAHRKWEESFKQYNEAKEAFLKMKLVRS